MFLFLLVLLLYLLKLRVHLGEDRLDRGDGMLMLIVDLDLVCHDRGVVHLLASVHRGVMDHHRGVCIFYRNHHGWLELLSMVHRSERRFPSIFNGSIHSCRS